MRPRRIQAGLLALAAVGCVGLGAELQREEYLRTLAGSPVVGYTVALTAPLAALCAAAALARSTPPQGDRRMLAFAAIVAGLSVLLFILQYGWINALVSDELLPGTLNVSPIASNADGAASLLVPIFATAA